MIKDNEKAEETKVLEPEQVRIIIPECCRKGWDSCIHVAKPPKKEKRNVGL